MTSPVDGVALDVEALRRAADLLRSSVPVLGDTTAGVGRALDEAAPAAGQRALATALAEFARRWAEGVATVAGRVDAYGVLLRAGVDAHVGDDEAGAAALDPPR